MALRQYACRHCGHWQPWFAEQNPPFCPVCVDVRNALPDDGFAWATTADADAELTTHARELIPGKLWAFSCTPKFGLGATGWLLLHPRGNVAFEAAPRYSPEALETIRGLGGVRTLSTSHPHGYGGLWQLQEAFSPELPLQKEDLKYTKAFKVTRPYDATHEIYPDLTLHHTGGHYEGHSVLYWDEIAACFCGDALKIDFNGDGQVHEDGADGPADDGSTRTGTVTAISCHKGFHYQIPLSPDELRRYRDVFAKLPFTTALTPFEYAPGVTREHAVSLYELLLEGRAHTTPVPISYLEDCY
jgi:hypothetical protein